MGITILITITAHLIYILHFALLYKDYNYNFVFMVLEAVYKIILIFVYGLLKSKIAFYTKYYSLPTQCFRFMIIMDT